MPAGKRQQTNNLLYALIIFVGLFIVALVAAIVFYIKFEEQRTIAATSQSKLEEMTTTSEQRKGLGNIVGTIPHGKSGLGTMVDYLDEMVSLIIGGLPEEDASAEVKVDTAKRKTKDTIELLAQTQLEQPETPDTEDVGLKAVAKEFVDLLVEGQFSTATENFDTTMKDALPTEKLEEVWNVTTKQTGPFKQQIGVRAEKELSYDVVFVTCEFERGHLDIKVVYNSEGQVAGLFFLPTPPEVLESYQRISETITETITENINPNTAGLIRIIEKLKINLDNTTNTALALQEQLEELQKRFDDAMTAGREKEQTLLAEKEKYQQQVNDIKQDYNALRALMKQTTEQQVQILSAQLDEEKANRRELTQELLKTQAEFKMTQGRMKRIQEKLQRLVPPPDSEVAAFKSDGKIMLIDDQAKIVHLDIGSNDHVYRGLTFSVYDKGMPIPRDGTGKAEIEVFDIAKTFSAARIIPSETNKPIIQDDIVANLIWDSDRINVLVVAGDFDLDGDGDIDDGAVDKIKALVEKWGGRVADTVSVDTDFLVLGTAPEVRRKPTFEQMEIDPMAMEKYEASLQKLAHYREVQNRAQTLSIPVFNYERFLYFIGYKAQSSRPGAF